MIKVKQLLVVKLLNNQPPILYVHVDLYFLVFEIGITVTLMPDFCKSEVAVWDLL